MEVKRGKRLPCGAYDRFWVVRNIRHAIYKKYKRPVTNDLIETIIKIAEEGE